MKFKAIVFDMDGTIIDTEGIWKSATYDLITSRGIVLEKGYEVELEKKIKGLAMHKSIAIIKDMFKLEDEIEHLIIEKKRRANQRYEEGITFIKGFEQFHKQATALGIKTGLATNATDCTLAIATKKMQLDRFFGKHLYNISHVNNVCKPDPALYLYAANQLDVAPEECIAIEDSAHGIQAAVSAGMYCLGINTAQNREHLKQSHQIIEGYHEIDLNTLLSLPRQEKRTSIHPETK